MKNKYLFLIGVFLVCIMLLFASKTYSLFETNAVGGSEMEIGKWVIYLNDVDITYAETLTLNNFTYSDSVHIEDGYFAPSRTAEFILEIDASETDVAVIYNIDIDDSAIEAFPNIHFVITDMSTNQAVNTTVFEDVIPLTAQSRTKSIKIQLVWDNQLAYDESDTILVGEELEFVVQANFKQYLGDS